MNEIASLVPLLIPFIVIALFPLIIFGWAVIGAKKPIIWISLYFSLLFYFSNATWGLVDASATNNFYNRGTGFFYFSLINLFLIGLTIQAYFVRQLKIHLPIKHNLSVQSSFFWLLLMGNVLVGSILNNISWNEIISYSGLLNIANFMLAFYVLMSAIRTSSDFDKLVDLILFCAVTRGIWGVIRYFAFGGDPANFYANFQEISVKLTFFDINDSLVAVLALFICAWRLANRLYKSSWERLLYWLTILIELFIIVFSYRRTAWGGLSLAAILFALHQQKRLKMLLLFSYLSIGTPALLYKMLERSSNISSSAPLIERILPDIAGGGEVNFTSGRFAELYAAFLSIKDSPLWGLGAWGRYSGFRFSDLAWHHGNFGWMHSGLLHLVLKTGLIGAGISISVLIAFFYHVTKVQSSLSINHKGIMLTGAAGVLFLLPNWLIGTPVIEYRTMQLTAFTMGLTYLASSLGQIKVE